MKINNVLTIDVEDYFQVAALSKSISVNDWDNITTRVEANTNELLNLFDEKSTRATFFILGWVAERYPQLVREIHDRGHEVASHGYSHQLIYNQTPEVFRNETVKSKCILEDIIGAEISGYRAASYSITKNSLWALDVLIEAGFKYDSSIFPVRHDNYGMPGTPTEPYVLKTSKGNVLVEYPLSTYRLVGQSIPVAGGGYFRLYPYWLTRYFYNSINNSSRSFVFYMHPWEIDKSQPRVKASWFSEFRHYNNLEKCKGRLATLLDEFSFVPMNDKLTEMGIYRSTDKPLVEYRTSV